VNPVKQGLLKKAASAATLPDNQPRTCIWTYLTEYWVVWLMDLIPEPFSL